MLVAFKLYSALREEKTTLRKQHFLISPSTFRPVRIFDAKLWTFEDLNQEIVFESTFRLCPRISDASEASMSIFSDGKKADFSSTIDLVHSPYFLGFFVVVSLADTVSINPKIIHLQRQGTSNGILDGGWQAVEEAIVFRGGLDTLGSPHITQCTIRLMALHSLHATRVAIDQFPGGNSCGFTTDVVLITTVDPFSGYGEVNSCWLNLPDF